jgi:HlyD family secretion protein
VWWGVGIAAVAVAYFAFRSLSQASHSDMQYRTELVVRRNIQRTTEAVGTLDVAHRVVVPAVTDGQLVEILVHQGDEVSAGQALARLDEQAAQRDVQSAQATLGGSAARLAQAQAALAATVEERQRTEKLLARGLASDSAMSTARAAEAEARARVQAAGAEWQLSQQGLKGAKIKQGLSTLMAPEAGFVLSATEDLGAMVGPRSAPLFVVAAPIDHLKLSAPIAEADIGAVRIGQSAQFSVPAYPGRTFSAKVQKLDVEPVREGSAVSYRVSLDVDNPDKVLLPGMTANVKIELARVENALAVREAALRFVPSDAPEAAPRSRVWHPVGSNDLEAVMVTAGVSDGAYTEVKAEGSSLTEGDRVVVGLAVGAAANNNGPGISLGKKQ